MDRENKNPRGRKPMPAAEVIDVGVNEHALDEERTAVAILGPQLREIDASLLDGRTYDRVALVDEARFFMGQANAAFFEVGRRLIVIKEHEPFGDFERIVESLGMNVRSAQRVMQATRKFMGPKLAGQPKLLQLGQGRLFELLVEDDDDLAELAEGGTLAGLKLDDMQTMTTRELRLALADARKDKAAKDKVLKEKNDKIDKLSEQLHRRASTDTLERERAQLDELGQVMLHADLALASATSLAIKVFNEPVTGRAQLQARQSIELLMRHLVDVCMEHRIEVDLAAELDPEWYAAIKDFASMGMEVEEAKRAARKALRRDASSGDDA